MLESGPPATGPVVEELLIDGYAQELLLQTARRRLQRRFDQLAGTEVDDLRLLQELRTEMTSVGERITQLRETLDELADHLPANLARRGT